MREEQQLVGEANHVLLTRVLSAVQAARLLLAYHPEPFDCLGLANALASDAAGAASVAAGAGGEAAGGGSEAAATATR